MSGTIHRLLPISVVGRYHRTCFSCCTIWMKLNTITKIQECCLSATFHFHIFVLYSEHRKKGGKHLCVASLLAFLRSIRRAPQKSSTSIRLAVYQPKASKALYSWTESALSHQHEMSSPTHMAATRGNCSTAYISTTTVLYPLTENGSRPPANAAATATLISTAPASMVQVSKKSLQHPHQRWDGYLSWWQRSCLRIYRNVGHRSQDRPQNIISPTKRKWKMPPGVHTGTLSFRGHQTANDLSFRPTAILCGLGTVTERNGNICKSYQFTLSGLMTRFHKLTM